MPRKLLKSFKFVELRGAEAAESTFVQPATETDLSLCFVGQKNDTRVDDNQNAHHDKESSYSILAGQLRKFNELGLLPKSFLLSQLGEGSGVGAELNADNARYHKTCRLKYNKTRLDRAKKMHLKIGAHDEKANSISVMTIKY